MAFAMCEGEGCGKFFDAKDRNYTEGGGALCDDCLEKKRQADQAALEQAYQSFRKVEDDGDRLAAWLHELGGEGREFIFHVVRFYREEAKTPDQKHLMHELMRSIGRELYWDMAEMLKEDEEEEED